METEVYTVADVVKMLHWSRRTIVRMFENEPGVLIIRKPNGERRSLRIPRPVYQRVVRRLTVQ
jgi:hypothetical protein